MLLLCMQSYIYSEFKIFYGIRTSCVHMNGTYPQHIVYKMIYNSFTTMFCILNMLS